LVSLALLKIKIHGHTWPTLIGVIVAIAVPRISIIPWIAGIPWLVARAVIPAVAVCVTSVLPVTISIAIPMALVFDKLDVGGVYRYCFRHDDRRRV